MTVTFVLAPNMQALSSESTVSRYALTLTDGGSK